MNETKFKIGQNEIIKVNILVDKTFNKTKIKRFFNVKCQFLINIHYRQVYSILNVLGKDIGKKGRQYLRLLIFPLVLCLCLKPLSFMLKILP